MRLTEKSFGGVYGKKLERGNYATNTECMNRLYELENVICDADGNEIISLDRLRELAEAERDGRIHISQYPNCQMCEWVTKIMFVNIEPCVSCKARALADPKGEATT